METILPATQEVTAHRLARLTVVVMALLLDRPMDMVDMEGTTAGTAARHLAHLRCKVISPIRLQMVRR